MDEEFILIDRLDIIRKVVNKYGEDKFVLSFSGGKDSVILHHLLDLALPDNKIPRVFINTGIEYSEIVKYVKTHVSSDDRFSIIPPIMSLQKIFSHYGYPFKSKEHSQLVHMYQQNGFNNSVERYCNPPQERLRYGCPKILKYQFEGKCSLPISNECCNKLKKQPFATWQKENNKPFKLTGERVEEGGLRSSHGDCLVIDKGGQLKKFKPLNKVTSDWEDWFVKEYNIKLCSLYYEPYNFQRSGCRGCPYNIKARYDLAKLYTTDINEYKRTIAIWKPVYDEMIRIGYRIKKYPHEMSEKELGGLIK